MSGQKKRSFTLFSHPTSVALEPVFWEVLESIARDKKCSLTALILEVDQNRSVSQNLSASLREFVVRALLEKIDYPRKND